MSIPLLSLWVCPDMRKIPTLFVRDFEHDNGRYVIDEVTPGCEWVLAREGVPTRKWDGTCIRVRNDGVYAFYARREVKAGKPTPNGFEPIETDEVTGKTVGWEPWSLSPFAAFITEAKANWAATHPLPDVWIGDVPHGTYELVGPKINGNPDEFDTHRLVPHGRETLALDDRSYDGIRSFLLRFDHMEGIVFWRKLGNPDAGLAKIKRRDFRGVS